MKETPILFKTEMVKAILEGRKTMTRRIVKGFNASVNAYGNLNWDFTKGRVYAGATNCEIENLSDPFLGIVDYCPFGKVGDVLWVKETWLPVKSLCEGRWTDRIAYKANDVDNANWVKWKSSLFMPKEAARVWLEITDIKVERLQDISEEDAIMEGIKCCDTEIGKMYKDYLFPTDRYGEPSSDFPLTSFPKYSFQTLWQSINGEESWNSNPFVWVISFKALSTTGKPKFKKLESIEN